jgi:undecaprenyl-diphosphatase
VLWVKHLDAPKWFDEIMRDCTAFGGVFVLTLTTLAVGVYFGAKRLWHALAFLMTSVIGAFILSMCLKRLFNRPRPDIIEHGSYTYTTSFPSGHAMLSAAVWLTLGVLLARLEKSPWLKAYFILLGLFISFMAGISRVWLGVHWPTDVLAGWAGGTVWAIACWFLARYLQHRGTMERTMIV